MVRGPWLRAAALLLAAAALAAASLGTQAFAPGGRAPPRRPRADSAVARPVITTGRTRAGPPAPGIWYEKPEPGKEWPPRFEDVQYGWNSETGKWQDLPREGILKWWQRPGYLTPNGYRQPPHWNKRDYVVALQELRFAQVEAALVEELKRRGMTIEEIRARAEMYEFIEDPNKPMTNKMRFLMQVKCLFDGREEDLIDMRDEAEEPAAAAKS